MGGSRPADPGSIRWYRTPRRTISLSALNSVAALVFVVDPTLLVLLFTKTISSWYELLEAEIAVLAWLVVRSAQAGIMLSGDGVTLRSALGRKRRVPWSHVAGFELVHRPGEYLPAVRTEDGRGLHTRGCSFKARDRGRAAAVVQKLNADRLARAVPVDAAAPWPDRRKIARGDFLSAEMRVFGPLAGMTAAGVALIAAAIIGTFYAHHEIGPAVRAENGQGQPGSFVARSESCGKGGCWWTGDFTVRGGETRHDISLAEPDSSLQSGQAVTALDTGPAGQVYLPRDSWPVENYAVLIVLCAVSGIAGAVVLAGAWRREHRRRQHAGTLASAGATASGAV